MEWEWAWQGMARHGKAWRVSKSGPHPEIPRQERQGRQGRRGRQDSSRRSAALLIHVRYSYGRERRGCRGPSSTQYSTSASRGSRNNASLRHAGRERTGGGAGQANALRRDAFLHAPVPRAGGSEPGTRAARRALEPGALSPEPGRPGAVGPGLGLGLGLVTTEIPQLLCSGRVANIVCDRNFIVSASAHDNPQRTQPEEALVGVRPLQGGRQGRLDG